MILILDGCADEPQEILRGKTPLMAASIPNINGMAKNGTVGRAKTVPDGIAPGSDPAILSIFGYSPLTYYTGRSPLEAAGLGVSLREGNLSFRLNLAAIGGEGGFDDLVMQSHSGGNIEGDEAEALMEALLSDTHMKALLSEMKMEITPTRTFRHIAVLQSSPGTLKTEPPHEIIGEKIIGRLPRGYDKLIEFSRLSYEILNGHPINVQRRGRKQLPANCAWLWGEGGAVELPSFYEKYGKKAAAVTAVPLVKGIARLAGADVIEVPGATGDLHTDYEGKGRAAAYALNHGADCVFVHVEAPDECSHDGDTEGKLEALNRADSRLIPAFNEAMGGQPVRWLILSDHYTLLSTRGHDATPVPFLLYDSEAPNGSNASFDEPSAAEGPFLDPATGLMDLLFKDESF